MPSLSRSRHRSWGGRTHRKNRGQILLLVLIVGMMAAGVGIFLRGHRPDSHASEQMVVVHADASSASAVPASVPSASALAAAPQASSAPRAPTSGGSSTAARTGASRAKGEVSAQPHTSRPSVSRSAPTSPSPISVSTSEQLSQALAAAQPGDVVTLAPGAYTGPGWVAGASGTSTRPITVRGPRTAVLTTGGFLDSAALTITGSYWKIQGVSITNATRAVVVDRSTGTVLEDLHVYGVGAEGVVFRACSLNSVLRNSLVEDTGQATPGNGEGVYVGSSQARWGEPGRTCTDGKDHTNGTLIEGNTFRNLPAEGADLKEGTDSGTLRNNTFDNVAFSNQDSADSAVALMGSHWTVSANLVRNNQPSFRDGIQVADVTPGYGRGNVLSGNRIEGPIPGFGITLLPQHDNHVTCDNLAPQAYMGVVGNWGTAVSCQD